VSFGLRLTCARHEGGKANECFHVSLRIFVTRTLPIRHRRTPADVTASRYGKSIAISVYRRDLGDALGF
jgi:hypothetical protein